MSLTIVGVCEKIRIKRLVQYMLTLLLELATWFNLHPHIRLRADVICWSHRKQLFTENCGCDGVLTRFPQKTSQQSQSQSWYTTYMNALCKSAHQGYPRNHVLTNSNCNFAKLMNLN